jgi:hypothetical protein
MTLFRVYEGTPLSARGPATKPTLDGKLLCALYSLHLTRYAGVIFNAWRVAGIMMLTIKGQHFDFAASTPGVKKTLCDNCCDRGSGRATPPTKV